MYVCILGGVNPLTVSLLRDCYRSVAVRLSIFSLLQTQSGFGKKIRNSQDNARGKGSSKAAVLDLYGVYTLLFGTEENDFSLGLTDQWRIKLNKRLDKVKREYTASEPTDEWASSRYVLRVSDSHY